MANYFCDSSALIKYYVIEKGSKWINIIFDPSQGNLLFVSQIVEVELASALSRRVREGTLSQSNHGILLNLFGYHQLMLLRVVNLEGDLTRKANALTLTRALRTNDAIQLASAVERNRQLIQAGLSGLTFLSSDIRLLAAAQAECLQVDNPENYP